MEIESSYLLNNLSNFIEIFVKDVTYDNIKVTKNQGFTLSVEDKLFKKPQGGQIDSSTIFYISPNDSPSKFLKNTFFNLKSILHFADIQPFIIFLLLVQLFKT